MTIAHAVLTDSTMELACGKLRPSRRKTLQASGMWLSSISLKLNPEEAKYGLGAKNALQARRGRDSREHGRQVVDLDPDRRVRLASARSMHGFCCT